MKKITTKNTAVPESNKQFQGVDKDPLEEKDHGEPVTKNDLKAKAVDRVIADKENKRATKEK